MFAWFLTGLDGTASPVRAAAADAPRPTRVLVVEDDWPTRAAMTRLLRDRGLDVRAAADLAGGLAALEAWRPHGVVLDLMLPDGSGLALLARVRTEALPVRVAVVTATSDPDLLDAVRRLGPDLLLRKPTDVEALVEFLKAPRQAGGRE